MKISGHLAAFSCKEYVNRPYKNERIPKGHIGEPVDAAEAVAFLVSDEAKYIVGAGDIYWEL